MEDDAIVQIISRLGVDFSQAILSAEKLAASMNIANTSLTNLKATAAAMGAITVGQSSVTGITKATENATQVTKKHTKSVQDLNKEYGVLGSMAERRASWFVTGSMFFGAVTGLKEIVTTIKDVEMGMTTIARVTEDTTFSFKGMRDELQQLGVTYGNVWADTSDVATRWAQAGYNMKDTLELTKDSLLAMNTAELSSEQAWAA